jgi:CRISPR/Cas system CMR-associated protein Cmr1 (group 7 of RAMP superfamily)
MATTTVHEEECVELNNIKYKTMLLNGNPQKETIANNNMSNLDTFLENEKNHNNNEPWFKLNKTVKIQKMAEFIKKYKKDKNLSDEEETLLMVFLKDCLDRKKLQKVKDVVYDKTTGLIKDLPSLLYIKSSKHFTLKNVEKRISTLKSLPTKLDKN